MKTTVKIVVFALLLAAVPAFAQGSYAVSLSITGLAGGGDYVPFSFYWGPSPTKNGLSHTLTWKGATDSSDQYLIGAAQAGQVFSSAEIQSTLMGTAEVDIVMNNVTVRSYQVVADSQGPMKVVTLQFDSVTYTFQALLPNGQKSGPPFTITQTFKK